MIGFLKTFEGMNPTDRAKTIEALKEQVDNNLKKLAPTGNENTKTLDEVLNRQTAKLNEQFSGNTNTKESTAVIKNKTTEGLLYFIAIDSLERLDIQFVPDLDIQRNANIATIQIVGRNLPQYQYTGGDTVLNLQLDFHSLEENRTDVINKCRWLEHLTANNGLKKKPSKVKLVFGDVFRDEQWIVKQVGYKLNNFHKGYGFLPQQAIVNIQLLLDVESDINWDSIRSDGGSKYLR